MSGADENTLHEQPLVRMERIGKCFGPVRVLEAVDFELRSGEVHVLAGDVGALGEVIVTAAPLPLAEHQRMPGPHPRRQ